MPVTVNDQVWKNGVLVSSTPRVVSDDELNRLAAPARMRQAYASLRQWSADAQTVFGNWGTMSAAQKDAANKEVIRRFGLTCAGLADLLLNLSLDDGSD